MKIKWWEQILEEAERVGACWQGLMWWKKYHDYDLLAKEHPDWYLWGAKHCSLWERNYKRFNRSIWLAEIVYHLRNK